jgi:hypothetical protein
MKHRFLIHSLNHTTLLVDITPVGIPSEVLPSEGKPQSLSSRRFQGWPAAEKYLVDCGVDDTQLKKLRSSLKQSGTAVVTIP